MTLFMLLTISSLSLGEEEAITVPTTAPLSPEGNRQSEKIQTLLDSELQATEKNVQLCNQNIQTIELELQVLNELAKSHQNLIAKYEAVLALSQNEINNNNRAIATLDQKNSGKEKTEREQWNAIEANKNLQMQKLIADLSAQIAAVSSQKIPLFAEIKEWENRKREQISIASRLQKKKEEILKKQ